MGYSFMYMVGWIAVKIYLKLTKVSLVRLHIEGCFKVAKLPSDYRLPWHARNAYKKGPVIHTAE